MVWIKPDEFTIDSPSGEDGRNDDEGPQTRVRLSKGFWLGKYEVTQAEWQAVMGTSVREQGRKALVDDTLYGPRVTKRRFATAWSRSGCRLGERGSWRRCSASDALCLVDGGY